jgi:hypothetical protein
VTSQQLLLGGAGESGYNLTRSLRFRASASAYLNRTPAAGNRQIWTYSTWVKRGTFGGDQYVIRVGNFPNLRGGLFFDSQNNLRYLSNPSGSSETANLISTAVYRDSSAWYHVVLALDSTQATAANRVKLYVNGVQVTAFGTATYPPLNENGSINAASIHYIGRDGASAYFDGYLAEVNFIDGQALTPSSFGSTNALTGVWQPARYTGTYGTNGFYLPFTDNSTASALGTDFSGNSNTWTTNNISVTAGVTYDSMTDVPTLTSATAANYCVVNPVFAGANSIINANLTVAYAAASTAYRQLCTFSVGSGKYYYEANLSSFAVGDAGNNQMVIGFCSSAVNNTRIQYGWNSDGTIMRHQLRYFVANTSITTVNIDTTAFISTDILALAFDIDAGTITAYKNNVQVAQITSITNTGDWTPMVQRDGSSNAATWNFNFGQRPFAYTPPTGFVALNAFNLPAATIVKGNTVMDATLYTGNGSTQTITNAAGFRPDFVWVKGRSTSARNRLFNVLSGVQKELYSDLTNAEATDVNSIQSFNSNGFTLGSNDANTNTTTYVGWQWQAGQGSSSSNTDGSITSTVSVNASAGFSVVTYTGTGSAATIGHGLGVAPKMVIVKNRSAGSTNWAVYTSMTGVNNVLFLNNTDASTAVTGKWSGTNSSVFGVNAANDINGSGNTYVAYCWSEIDGFSKFGSYTGNGSADGPMIYTGFRPKFFLYKRTDRSGDYWNLLDTSRNTYNVATNVLCPNVNDSEYATGTNIDFVSNGIKIRATDNSTNGSGGTFIYMAFAENPFKNSLAR